MKNDNKLTIVIPFLNEEEEVRNTVISIREHVDCKIDIILINDASDDQYDYEEDLKDCNVRLIENKERLGSAKSRNLGISLVQTPYFLSLDAHMRFYEKEWLDIIVEKLEDDDRKILCCQTKVLNKSFWGEIETPVKSPVFGAHILFERGADFLNVKWNKKESCPGIDTEKIPCVLGAAYACSKRYWTYLKGLKGLVGYGGEEAYISMKVYMEGGCCELLKNVIVGHIYRTRFPYRMSSDDLVYNKLLIAELLLPESLKNSVFIEFEKMNRTAYDYSCAKLEESAGLVEELKDYYRSIFKVDFDEFMQMNIMG